MRRIADRVRRARRDLAGDESGISLIFVTLTLVVLVGMVAFAVDTGALYQERRELQSGADAAAFAVAEDCALNAQPCNQTQADITAASYADANAGDLRAALDNVDLDLVSQIVEVDVSTETSDGGTIFRPFFAQVVGFDGTTVHAEAAVQWGYLGSLTTIPLIVSYCEWERETNNGADYDPATGKGLHGLHEPTAVNPWQGATPTLFKFHTGNQAADDCAAQAGQDTDGDGRLPGGFGWISDDDGLSDCFVHLETGNQAPGDPGASPTTGCSAATLKSLIFEKTVLMPWFIDVNGAGGANAEYTIENFVGLYVTGYNFGGQFKEPKTSPPCSGAVRCLEGYLKHAEASTGEIGGTNGVIVVKFIK